MSWRALILGVLLLGLARADVLTLRQSVDRALETSPVLQNFRAQVAQAEANVDLARSLGRPTLNLQGTYQYATPPGGQFATDNGIGVLVLQQAIATFGRLHFSVLAAQLSVEQARQNLTYQQDLLVEQVVAAYSQALIARHAVAIAEDNLKSQQRHLRDAQVARKAGIVADFDVLRTEAAASQAERDLLAAQNLQRQTMAALQTQLSEPVRQERELEELAMPGPPPDPSNDEVEQALLRRPDLNAAETAVRQGEALVGLAESGDAPALNLQTQLQERNPVGTTPQLQYTAGLVFSWPLFDGGVAGAQSEAARQAVLSLRAQLTDAVRQAKLDLFNAGSDLATQWETVRVAERNVVQAREALRIAELRYKFGLGTNVELLDAQSAYTTAQLAEVRAHYDYIAKWARFSRLMGVEWPPAAANP